MAEVDKLAALRILVDTTSLEIFVNNGEQVMTTRYYPQQADNILTIDGNCQAEIYDMDAMQMDYLS